MNKEIVYTFLSLFLSFVFFSCSKEDGEEFYGTKFHSYFWNADSMPLEISSSNYEKVFEAKDRYDNGCSLSFNFIWQEGGDTLQILESNGTDTLNVSDWYTAIIEDNKRVRIIVDENTDGKERFFGIAFFGGHTTYKGDGMCWVEELEITQLPK